MRLFRRRPRPATPAGLSTLPDRMPAVRVMRCRCHAPWCEEWRADCPCGKGWRTGTLRTAHSVARYHSERCSRLQQMRFLAVPLLPSQVRAGGQR